MPDREGHQMIRECTPSDGQAMYAVINDAARAYQGVIPEDRWREPYMPLEELLSEIDDGVAFRGLWEEGALLGLIGLQDRGGGGAHPPCVRPHFAAAGRNRHAPAEIPRRADPQLVVAGTPRGFGVPPVPGPIERKARE
jgi:hypothetical protein